MDTVIKIVGIAIMLMGVLYITYPSIMLRLIEFFKKGCRIYFAAVLRLVLAVLFLVSANSCRHPRLVIAFGILLLLGGLLIPLLGRKRIDAVLDYYGTRPLWLLRIFASLALVMGALIIYAA